VCYLGGRTPSLIAIHIHDLKKKKPKEKKSIVDENLHYMNMYACIPVVGTDIGCITVEKL